MQKLIRSLFVAALAFLAVSMAPSAAAQGQTTCYEVVKQSFLGTLDLDVCVTLYEGGGEVHVDGTLTLRDGSVVEIAGHGAIAVAPGVVTITGEVTITYGDESWTVPVKVAASTVKKATSSFVTAVSRLAL